MAVEELHKELEGMVHRLYQTPEFMVYNTVPITLARVKVVRLHRFHFSRARRDCWAAVQCTAPIDVKRLVWEHEGDELNPGRQLGTHNFWSSLDKAMKVTGLSAEEIYSAELIPGCKAALRAWLHLARDSSWLKAFSGTAVLEMVKEGGTGAREHERYTDEVRRLFQGPGEASSGAPVAEERSDIMEVVLKRYAMSEGAQREVLEGVKDSLDFDRAFIGALVAVLEEIRE